VASCFSFAIPVSAQKLVARTTGSVVRGVVTIAVTQDTIPAQGYMSITLMAIFHGATGSERDKARRSWSTSGTRSLRWRECPSRSPTLHQDGKAPPYEWTSRSRQDNERAELDVHARE